MKDKRFEIRISEQEIAEIKKAANILKLTPSMYIRKTMDNRNKRVIAKSTIANKVDL